MELSIVIPIYNEEANIGPLLERIANVMPQLPSPQEVILVDDGSRDATVAKVLAARAQYSWLKLVELRRNFGQHAATYAGFDQAQGNIVVTLDGDLQNNPTDIPKLLEKMQEGYDVVCGWRTDRKDPFLSRKLPSLIVNKLIRGDAPTPIHDYGCFLRAYTQQAAKELAHFSTARGWFPVLFSKLGFRVSEVPVSHAERPGQESSKHGFFTRLDQFMSVFMGVTRKPFQFVQVLGGGVMFLGAIGMVGSLAVKLAQPETQVFVWLICCMGLVLWGLLVGVLGTIGEYIVGMNYELGKSPKYLVRRTHE